MKSFGERVFKLRNQLQERLDNKRDVLYDCVSFKLDRSYNNYLKEIEEKTNYILSRNNYKVVKTLSRQVKEEELNKSKKKSDDLEDDNNE